MFKKIKTFVNQYRYRFQKSRFPTSEDNSKDIINFFFSIFVKEIII